MWVLMLPYPQRRRLHNLAPLLSQSRDKAHCFNSLAARDLGTGGGVAGSGASLDQVEGALGGLGLEAHSRRKRDRERGRDPLSTGVSEDRWGI